MLEKYSKTRDGSRSLSILKFTALGSSGQPGLHNELLSEKEMFFLNCIM